MERLEDTVNAVLTQLADELELDASALCLENGYTCLGVNKTKMLHLRLQEAANSVDMFMELGMVPHAARQSVCEDMLRGNILFQATEGASLGYDPERGIAVLSMRIFVPGMNLVNFRDRLERFLSVAEFWQTRIAGEPSSDMALPGGLLRV